MQVLDSTIANVSLPTIAGNLGASTDQSTWVITAFAVANGIGVPMTGWLMGRYGVVKTFVFSVFAFTVASFLCGVAWSLPSLIFFRVLQGGVSGPDDSWIAGASDLDLSVRQARRGARHLVDHHIGCTHLRPDLGWLYLRQLPLGLDLSNQRACWTDCFFSLLVQFGQPRNANP